MFSNGCNINDATLYNIALFHSLQLNWQYANDAEDLKPYIYGEYQQKTTGVQYWKKYPYNNNWLSDIYQHLNIEYM